MLKRDGRIPDLVTVTEAAHMLGITRQAISKMVHKKQLRGAQIGGRWVFRRAAVAEHLHQDTDENAEDTVETVDDTDAG